jgi:hypothetical protein
MSNPSSSMAAGRLCEDLTTVILSQLGQTSDFRFLLQHWHWVNHNGTSGLVNDEVLIMK